MTQIQEETKLPPTEKLEGEMPNVICQQCGRSRPIQFSNVVYGGVHDAWAYQDELHGTVVCGGCKHRTVVGMKGNDLIFLPGKLFEEELDRNVPDTAKASFQDGVLAFYGQAKRAVLAMCRSAIEEALDDKGAQGKDLFEKIKDAAKIGILGQEEVTQAHAARLVGRNVLHRGMDVSQSQAQLALTSTIQLLNHIARQRRPASQSGRGSHDQLDTSHKANHPLVVIEWLDSHYVPGWHTEEPYTAPLRCRSVGWLLYDGEEAKTIAAHITQEETPQRCGEITIPTCAIVQIKDLS